MAGYICVVADRETGQSHQFEAEEADLRGRRLGEEIDGETIGLSGYTLQLTGGSDAAGRPMHGDVEGTQPTKILSGGGTGFRPKRDGERRRVTVRGNQIGADTTQLNFTIVEAGETPIDELLE